jgi:hypothetical protein
VVLNESPAALGPIVRLRASDDDPHKFPSIVDSIGTLRPGSTVQVRADGFGAFDKGQARQCAASIAAVCGNPIEVQFGISGAAAFEYLLVDDFSPLASEGRCRARAPACSIVIEVPDGGRRAEVVTVFQDDVPPVGRIHVTPRTGVDDGEKVLVAVEDYFPGARVEAMLCAAPHVGNAARCGAPGPATTMTVGEDGTASAQMTMRREPVGAERVSCGRRQACGVAVVSRSTSAPAHVVPILFAGPPGADYDVARVGAGLGAAVLLLGLATLLVRRTDWSAIGEQAAPEIDQSEYADLDALIAAAVTRDEWSARPSG